MRPGDVVRLAGALDDRRLVLRDDDLAGGAEQVDRGVLELEADLLGDDGRAGEDRDVLQHGLAAVAEPGGLHRDGVERAADLVHDERGERLALDVLGQDQDRLAGLHDLLEHREQVLDRADLRVRDQDVGVVQDRLHPLGVGDEVRRDVALVEPHALGELELHAEGVRLFDRDDAVLADLVDGVGDLLADLGVGRGDGADVGDLFLRVDVLGDGLDPLDRELDRPLDAALERHRVRAGRDVAQAFLHDRLREHGRRRGAVTGDVVGLLRDLLDELGADLLERVVELDLLGDRDAVVRDRGGAPLLLEDDVAALGPQRDLHGVRELVHAALERAPRVLVERDDLRCHLLLPSCARFSAWPIDC